MLGNGSGCHHNKLLAHIGVQFVQSLRRHELPSIPPVTRRYPRPSGNLCAGCLPGYGQTGEAECSKCPPKSLNSLYYVLVSLVNVVMIMITIRAQLVRSEGGSGSPSDAAREAEGDCGDQVGPHGSGKPHSLLQRLSLWRKATKKGDENKLPDVSGGEPDGGERSDSAMGAPAARARALASASEVAAHPESSSGRPQQQKQEGNQGREVAGSKEGSEDDDDNEAVGDDELNQGTHSIVIKVKQRVPWHFVLHSGCQSPHISYWSRPRLTRDTSAKVACCTAASQSDNAPFARPRSALRTYLTHAPGCCRTPYTSDPGVVPASGLHCERRGAGVAIASGMAAQPG